MNCKVIIMELLFPVIQRYERFELISLFLVLKKTTNVTNTYLWKQTHSYPLSLPRLVSNSGISPRLNLRTKPN